MTDEVGRRAALGLLGAVGAAGRAAGQPVGEDVAALARDATVFAFPLHEFVRVRYRAHLDARNPGRQPLNRFVHSRHLLDHTHRAVTAPNNDTLYSSAFLDLSRGPVLLESPGFGARYHSFALMDAWTNNVAVAGTREDGPGPTRLLIAGPGWGGEAPAGARVLRSPTDAAWLLCRILATGPEDLPAVRALQDGLRLSGPEGAGAAAAATGAPAADTDAWGFFGVVARAAAAEAPPMPGRDDAMAARLRALGLGGGGPGPDSARMDEAARRAVETGYAEARRLIAATPVTGTVVGGWAYPAPGFGDFGADYPLRAAVALRVLAGLPGAEALYLPWVGGSLDGTRGAHRLRFAADALPPVDAFWSVSLYQVFPDGRLFFAGNAIARYSIGDRTPGLRRGADGSLEILMAREAPPDPGANWLPAPAAPFTLILRAYLPRAALRERRYAPPPVERVA